MNVRNKNSQCAVWLAAMVVSTTIPAQTPTSGPEQPDRQIDAREKSAVLSALSREIKDGYVFPDIAEKLVKMLEEAQSHGEYKAVTSAKEFGERLTRQL